MSIEPENNTSVDKRLRGDQTPYIRLTLYLLVSNYDIPKRIFRKSWFLKTKQNQNQK